MFLPASVTIFCDAIGSVVLPARATQPSRGGCESTTAMLAGGVA